MAKRRIEYKGQKGLPFGQTTAKKRKRESRKKGPSLAERRALKTTAYRLCRHTYAVLKTQPGLFRQKDISFHLREIGHHIGDYRKGRLTYAKAQAAIGAATSLLKAAGIEYKL